MDWRVIALMPLVMWAGYAVFGSLASRAHGENITIGIEAIAMMLVAGLALYRVGFADFHKATPISITHASIMGLLSAGGLFAQFYAFRIAPQNEQGTVVMLGGMFPVLAVVLFHTMAATGLQGGSLASPRQWLGVCCGALALWLVSGR